SKGKLPGRSPSLRRLAVSQSRRIGQVPPQLHPRQRGLPGGSSSRCADIVGSNPKHETHHGAFRHTEALVNAITMSIPVVGISREERVKSASHSRDQSVVSVRGDEIYSNAPEVRSFSCPPHESSVPHRD